MKLGTIKRYLEHYPLSFLVVKGISRVARKFVKPKTRAIGINEVAADNIKLFEPPHLPLQAKNKVIAIADKVVKGKIQVYRNFYAEKLIWQKDYVNGKVFGDEGCEVRIVWELNRCHYFVQLAEAFVLTKNEKYLERFKQLCSDWMKNNPFASTVNWFSPMEVAIRAVNWCTAASVFYKVDQDPVFWTRFFNCLFAHGVLIEKNLEWTPKIRGNHYVSNLAGLLYLGVLFERTPEGHFWIRKAHRELQHEISYQVGNDGAHFEKSTWYHGFVTELFFSAFLLMRAKRLKVAPKFVRILAKMFEFLLWSTRRDGSAVELGDSDSGRLLRFYPVRGFEDLIQRNNLFKIKNPDGLRVFDQSGFVFYHDKSILLTFFAGPTGTLGTGGHTHNSALSFTLDVNKKPVFLDPGTFLYTGKPEMRNLFRSTAYHNTLRIDGLEQNYLDERELFKLFDRTKAEITFTGKVRGAYTFAGRHYGYTSHSVVHERLIAINPKKRVVSIRDWISGKGVHNLEWNFHVANNKVVRIGKKLKIGSVEMELPVGFSPEIKDSWFSQNFGEKQHGKVISVKLERVFMPKMFHFITRY